MHKNRTYLAILAIAASASLLAACGESETPTPATDAAPSGMGESAPATGDATSPMAPAPEATPAPEEAPAGEQSSAEEPSMGDKVAETADKAGDAIADTAGKARDSIADAANKADKAIQDSIGGDGAKPADEFADKQ